MTGGECERRMGGRAYRSEYASDNVNRDVRKKKMSSWMGLTVGELSRWIRHVDNMKILKKKKKSI